MAKTGSIQFSYTQDTATNKSTVTVKGIIVTTGESYRGDSRTGTYTIKKGSTTIKTGSFTHGAPANSTTTLFEVSVTVEHADDGTCETITASYDYSSSWCAASGSLSLPTIARKSTLTVANGTLGTAQTLTISEKASAFVHKLYYSCGSTGGYILGSSSATSSSLSVSWTPPLSLASQNTTGTSVSITFTLYTYSGSSLIGSNTYTKTFAMPASVAPSCSIAISDYMGYSGTYGGYVKGKSRLKVVITATKSYGSDINAYSSSANGTTYTGSSFVTEVLKTSGEMTITSKVTDKRGRTGSDSETIDVLDYSAPMITALSVHRCDSDGTENDKGKYVKVTFSSNVTSLSSKNTAAYVVAYKKTSASSYTSVTLSALAKNYAVTDYEYIFAADEVSSYNVKVTVTDAFESGTMSTTVSTARTLLDFYSDRALSLGKVCEVEEGFEIGLPTFLHDGYDIQAHYGASNQYGLVKKVDELDTGKVNKSGDNLTGPLVFANNAGIYGTTTDGVKLVAVEPCSQYNNLSIGYGGYANGVGSTNIYGQTIRMTSTAAKLNQREYGVNKWLWSGGHYMSSDQTITLSEGISAQPNGVVLGFSYCISGTPQAYDWFWFFVPKYMVANHASQGINFSGLCEDGHMAKYLYLTDTTVKGYANNTAEKTVGGVTYNGTKFVLRYVIGV